MKRCSETSNEIESKVIDLLRKYPLCDSCLGRCFGKLSYGLRNEERGKGLKTSIMLELDFMVKSHKLEELLSLKEIMFNMGHIAEGWFRLYFPKEEFQYRACYICNNEIDDMKKDFLKKAEEILRSGQIGSYVLGVKLSDSIRMLEDDLVVKESLEYYESMKHEIKREVGKVLTERGLVPNIEDPDWEVIYDVSTRSVFKVKTTKKQLNFFNRLSRGVPISSWNSPYPNSLSSEFDKMGKKIFYSVSEQPDVRILTDYPLVTDEIDNIKIDGYYIKKSSQITRRDLSVIAAMKPKKKYKVTVFSTDPEEGWEKVYGDIYDVFIDANSPSEVMEKLKDSKAQILFIDLAAYHGRLSKVADLYMKGE